MRHFPALPTCLVIAALAAFSPAQAAAQAQQPQQAESAPATAEAPPSEPDQIRSLESLLNFTAAHAAMAGAVSTCNLQVFEAVRDCTQSVVQDWAVVSRLGSPGDAEYAGKAVANIWRRGFNDSQDRQTSLTPPMSCARVMDTIGRDPILATCARSGVRAPRQSAEPLRIQ